MLPSPDLRIFAKTRPGALPVPGSRDISALAKPNVLERWNDDGAGIRAVATGDNVITMFGAIGEDYWSDNPITAKKVAKFSSWDVIILLILHLIPTNSFIDPTL